MRLGAWIGLGIVGLWLAVAIAAPWLAPYPDGHRDLLAPLADPSPMHRLGTTEDGTDVLAALSHGARSAALVGGATVSISVALGLLLGLLAGWSGGAVDAALTALTEMFLAFPGFLLALLVVFVSGGGSLVAVVVALNLTGWAGFARLVRARVQTARRLAFVVAARAMGASTPRLLWHHILPNVVGPVTVQATFALAGAVVAEASLSFLGLGPQDTVSWGALLDEGAVLFLKTPQLALLSGGALAVTVLGVNLLGDALRDRLDPRSL